jgi:hypothetical protein
MPRGGLERCVLGLNSRIESLWTRHNSGDLEASAVLAQERKIT